MPATTMFFHFITPSGCLFAGLSRNLNECGLLQTHSLWSSASPHSIMLHRYEEPAQPGRNAHWDSGVDNWNSPLTVCCALLPALPMAYGALQQWAANAVVICVVLLVNGRQAGAVRRGRDRQLCVSNASSRIWVTLAPLSYCQIISPSFMIRRVILSQIELLN